MRTGLKGMSTKEENSIGKDLKIKKTVICTVKCKFLSLVNT